MAFKHILMEMLGARVGNRPEALPQVERWADEMTGHALLESYVITENSVGSRVLGTLRVNADKTISVA